MKHILSITLCMCLLALHFVSTSQQAASVAHTYVPPLTHTPGLGLSLLGEHAEPPFALLDVLHPKMTPEQKRSMDVLFQKHKTTLDEGVRLRLQMQSQTLELIEYLPKDTVHKAWQQRFHHEERIGEVRIWNDLVNR